MGRLDKIQKATRPKMHGRAMISGPSGAGKTWTGMGVAVKLAALEAVRRATEGEEPREGSSILVIDTERASALTYADVFAFEHLRWASPYDPTELADALDELGDRFDVVMIDSLSHFWRGAGGTLDIADGKIGGWKTARPVQERLVESLLAVPAHMILCVRSKMDYLIENGGRSVTKIGMAPIQDETLVYEVNVAFDLDLEHRMTVIKSRTPAVPVGRMYPAGFEAKAAEDYAEWLAGGIPPADRADVDQIVARFAGIADAELRKTTKALFVECFGMPHSLTAAQITEANDWLTERLDGGDKTPPATTDETGDNAGSGPGPEGAPGDTQDDAGSADPSPTEPDADATMAPETPTAGYPPGEEPFEPPADGGLLDTPAAAAVDTPDVATVPTTKRSRKSDAEKMADLNDQLEASRAAAGSRR